MVGFIFYVHYQKNHMKNVIVTEQNCKVGDKVVRGRDWCYANYQDNYGRYYGIIEEIHEGSRYNIRVEWQNGHRNGYRANSLLNDLYFYTKEMTPDLINRIGHLL